MEREQPVKTLCNFCFNFFWKVTRLNCGHSICQYCSQGKQLPITCCDCSITKKIQIGMNDSYAKAWEAKRKAKEILEDEPPKKAIRIQDLLLVKQEKVSNVNPLSILDSIHKILPYMEAPSVIKLRKVNLKVRSIVNEDAIRNYILQYHIVFSQQLELKDLDEMNIEELCIIIEAHGYYRQGKVYMDSFGWEKALLMFIKAGIKGHFKAQYYAYRIFNASERYTISPFNNTFYLEDMKRIEDGIIKEYKMLDTRPVICNIHLMRRIWDCLPNSFSKEDIGQKLRNRLEQIERNNFRKHLKVKLHKLIYSNQDEFLMTSLEYWQIKKKDKITLSLALIQEERGLYEKAFSLYEKVAKEGSTKAKFILGTFYQSGKGVPQDYKKAAAFYIEAAEKGHMLSQYILAQFYYLGKGVDQEFQKAAKWCKEAALQGYACAQYHLANCYKFGKGVERNVEEVEEWNQKAAKSYEDLAKKGDVMSQYSIGQCYELGIGVRKDYEKALKWYFEAATLGNSLAQFKCGCYYYDGKGVDRNYIEAFKWYEKAAVQGNPDAQLNFGTCYFLGNGVEQSYEKAVNWYQKSAIQGKVIAQHILAFCCEKGLGVEGNYQEAFKWYEKAANQGYIHAQEKLAVYHEKSIRVAKNYQ